MIEEVWQNEVKKLQTMLYQIAKKKRDLFLILCLVAVWFCQKKSLTDKFKILLLE
jgi:hypothetical protein